MNSTKQFCALTLISLYYSSVIILASLLVFPMLGSCHLLLRHGNISRFSLVESSSLYIPTCVNWPVGGTFPCTFGVYLQIKSRTAETSPFHRSLLTPVYYAHLKLDLCDKNNLQIKLKIRILSETRIPYLICHASFILIVSLHL